MIVKVEDAGFTNKGALLMLKAILQRLKEEYGNSLVVAVEPQIGSLKEKAELDLFQEVLFQRFRISNLIPDAQLRQYNLINPKTVNLVLNASGFSLGDQWCPYPDNFFNRKIRTYPVYKKSGARIIYMPQSFGPFKDERLIKYIGWLEQKVDLFYARDTISFNSMKEVLNQKEKLFQAPDFTNIYSSNLVKIKGKDNFEVAVIPNHKMVTKTLLSNEDYIDLITKMCFYIHNKGLRILLINHEGVMDVDIIKKVSENLNFPHKVLLDLSPESIKEILYQTLFTISSRYHGCISALSQGVPTLMTRWSHKYDELAKDYNSEKFLINGTETEEDVNQKLDNLINDNENIRRVLYSCARQHQKQTEEIWKTILN